MTTVGCKWCFHTIPPGVHIPYADKRFCSYQCRSNWLNDIMMLENRDGSHHVNDNPFPDYPDPPTRFNGVKVVK